ncbi:hypothetical protein BM1_05629 [Bipolaris maydis]|nr:hypothetical protein BM1_05629 [Bipolaris maydis]
MSKFCLLGSTGALPVRYVRYGPVQGPEWNFAAAAELVQDVGQCEPVPVLNAYIRLGKTGVGFAACAVQRQRLNEFPGHTQGLWNTLLVAGNYISQPRVVSGFVTSDITYKATV